MKILYYLNDVIKTADTKSHLVKIRRKKEISVEK